METKDDGLSWQDVIMNSMYAMKSTNDTINSLYDMINLEYSKVNGMKPLHFASPEKLNGEWRNSGQRGKITFIGRDLGLNADIVKKLCKALYGKFSLPSSSSMLPSLR